MNELFGFHALNLVHFNYHAFLFTLSLVSNIVILTDEMV